MYGTPKWMAPATVTLLTKLKVIANYEKSQPLPTAVIHVHWSTLEKSTVDALFESPAGEWQQYVALRHGGWVLFDPVRLKRLMHSISRLMVDKEKLSELLFMCASNNGRKRKRLYGAGRAGLVSEKLSGLVYARMVRLTYVRGSFNNIDILEAFKDYAPVQPGLRFLGAYTISMRVYDTMNVLMYEHDDNDDGI